MRFFIFFLLSFMTSYYGAAAYQFKNVEKVVPPTLGFANLKGYNLLTGQYADTCLEQVSGIETGHDADRRYHNEYVRSVSEASSFRDYDLNTELSINGITGGSISPEAEYFHRNRSRMETGAGFVSFFEPSVEEFVSSSAPFRLNTLGRDALGEAKRTGNFKKFHSVCGDHAVIGSQKARRMYATIYMKNPSAFSQDETDARAKFISAYIMNRFGVAMGIRDGLSSDQKDAEILIDFFTSGATQSARPVSIPSFVGVAKNFAAEPVSQSSSLANIYIIGYEHLLPEEAFDQDRLPRQRKQVEAIINGLTAIDTALNHARANRRLAASGSDKTKYKNLQARLQRQATHTRKVLKLEAGCIKNFSRACENLYAQYKNYSRAMKGQKLVNFHKEALRTNGVCAKGYIITRPDGGQKCKRCSIGKQPNFEGQNAGKCMYMPEKEAPEQAARLWIGEFKTQTPSDGSVLVGHPDKCNRKGKKCGEPAATRLCKSKGFGKSIGHDIWRPTLTTFKPRTQYKNGKWCAADTGGYNPTKCMTFLYVDCQQAPAGGLTVNVQ